MVGVVWMDPFAAKQVFVTDLVDLSSSRLRVVLDVVAS